MHVHEALSESDVDCFLFPAHLWKWHYQRVLAERTEAIMIVQASARRRTYLAVRAARREWARNRFKAGFLAHKMNFMREIRRRREMVLQLQAASRRALDSAVSI